MMPQPWNSKLIVKNSKANPDNDAIKIPHFVALSHLLRGFPFESKEKLQINYFGGSGSKKFMLCVRNKHRKTIQVMGKKIECYKLELVWPASCGLFCLNLNCGTALSRPTIWSDTKARKVRQEHPSVLLR